MKKNTEEGGGVNRLIRLNEVLDLLPLSRSSWWEGVRTGKFPRPIKLGTRITCWRLDEVLRLTEHGDSDAV